jgi:hypothetical protein
MREINIMVVGASGVGKTTFIQRAHDLRLPPKSALCARNLLVSNVLHTVRLIELDFDESLIANDKRITWPKRLDGEILPPIDGVLALYDVLNGDSIIKLPELLGKCITRDLYEGSY